MPHPPLACEISPTQVAAVRGSRARMALESYAVEVLTPGAVLPSAVEPNLADAGAVRVALERVLSRLQVAQEPLALLVPDQVVRVFLLNFESFPRRSDEAIPLLRWRLKKSVPFDVDDTVVSCVLQPARNSGVDVLAAVARQRVVRQYEELFEGLGLAPGIVLGSTLATLPLLDGERPTLLARLSGATLTTMIVRGDVLCVFRCTELSASAETLEPRALVDEIYPAVAYYQDTWQESVAQVRLAGFGDRYDEFRRLVEAEIAASVTPLVASAALDDRLSGEAKTLVDRRLDALVGWMKNRWA